MANPGERQSRGERSRQKQASDIPGTNKQYAVELAKGGFRVFPLWSVDSNGTCLCNTVRCKNEGKHPIGSLVPNGHKDASTDLKQIEAWWSRHPDANIGLPTGGVFYVIDIDSDEASSSLSLLADCQSEPWPLSTQVQTGRGNQVYFRKDPEVRVPNQQNMRSPNGSKIQGLDVRGEGGYVVAPPSLHKSGRTYEWIRGLDHLIQSPQWLLDLVSKPTPRMTACKNGPSRRPVDRELELVKEALTLISPDVCRQAWMENVGMPLHDAFGGSDEGFQIWDEWSTPSDKYPGVNEVRRQWNSLKTNHHNPKSLRSLFALAREHGWKPSTPFDDVVVADLTWPDPLPLDNVDSGLRPVPEADLMLLPEKLRPWAEDIAYRMQCSPAFVLVSTFVAIAGCVGRRIAVRPKAKDDWTEVPNLWGAIVAGPGELKTPTMAACLEPIHHLDAKATAAYLSEMKNFERLDEVIKLAKKQREKDINLKLAAGMAPQEIAECADTWRNALPKAPVQRRFLVNDPTVAALGAVLNENPDGVLIFRDELLGFLRGLERKGEEGARAFYLEAWGGKGVFQVDRIRRGHLRVNACVSLLGAITPGPLREHLAASLHDPAADDGMLQRFQLLVWPDPGGDEVVDERPNEKAREQAHAVFHRLAHIKSSDVGASPAQGSLPWVGLLPDAREAFLSWNSALRKRVKNGLEDNRLRAHLSKYPSMVASLAFLGWAADERPGTAVELRYVENAIHLAQFFEAHAMRVYQSAEPVTEDAQRIWLLAMEKGKDGRFSQREATRWVRWKTRRVTRALQLLQQRHWIRISVEGGTTAGGRKSTICEINPRARG